MIAEPTPDIDTICLDLKECQAMRVAALRSKVRLVNQCFALARRALGWQVDLADAKRSAVKTLAQKLVKALWAGKPIPKGTKEAADRIRGFCHSMKTALNVVLEYIKQTEKQMSGFAKMLPAADWAEAIKGFSVNGLAIIVGEAGNLDHYDNPGKLWKRMGLAPPNAYTMETKAGKTALAIPRRRRSAMWTLGASLWKQENEYRDLLLLRKKLEVAKAKAEGLIVVTTDKDTVARWKENGLPKLKKVTKADPAKHRTAAHVQNRAQRYIEKRLLRDLWRAWREASGHSRSDAHPERAAASAAPSRKDSHD